jgi:hypothetical protein
VTSRARLRKQRHDQAQHPMRHPADVVRLAELESAACWLLFEVTEAERSELVSRAVLVTETVADRWSPSDDESFFILESVSAALLTDAYWKSELPDEHVTDESLENCLRDMEKVFRYQRQRAKAGS